MLAKLETGDRVLAVSAARSSLRSREGWGTRLLLECTAWLRVLHSSLRVPVNIGAVLEASHHHQLLSVPNAEHKVDVVKESVNLFREGDFR